MGPIEPAAVTAATLLATNALEAAGGQAGETTWAGRRGQARPTVGTFTSHVEGLARVGSIINLAQVQGGVHFHLPPTALPEPVPASPAAAVYGPRLPAVWNVPYRRNPDFTGREQLLGDLAQQLSGGGTAPGTLSCMVAAVSARRLWRPSTPTSSGPGSTRCGGSGPRSPPPWSVTTATWPPPSPGRGPAGRPAAGRLGGASLAGRQCPLAAGPRQRRRPRGANLLTPTPGTNSCSLWPALMCPLAAEVEY
jgi:hypothetical protein